MFLLHDSPREGEGLHHFPADSSGTCCLCSSPCLSQGFCALLCFLQGLARGGGGGGGGGDSIRTLPPLPKEVKAGKSLDRCRDLTAVAAIPREASQDFPRWSRQCGCPYRPHCGRQA